MNIGNAVEVDNVRGGFLENAGSRDITVNGSVTAVLFTLALPETIGQFAISKIDLAFNCSGPLASGASFLNGAALTKGLEYGFIDKRGVQVPVSRGVIKTNMDIFTNDPHTQVNSTTANDLIVSCEIAGPMQTVIPADRVTAIYLKVQDDLSAILSGSAYCRINKVSAVR